MSAKRWRSPHGLVTILPPAGASPYYRLRYKDEFDRWRGTHAGRDLSTAKQKGAEVERRLRLADPGARAALRVADLLDGYIDPARPKFEREDPCERFWSSGYAEQVELRMRRIRPAMGRLYLLELSQRHIDVLVNAQPTYNQAHALRSTLRAVVSFGVDKGYLHPDQRFIAKVDIRVPRGPRPQRHQLQAEEGEHLGLVGPDEVPSDEAVHALGRAETGYDHWEGLANVLGYVGPRVHEALALTADDVVAGTSGWVLKVRRQLVEPRGGGVRVTAPKNRRSRSVPVVEATPCGFRLAEWLVQRAADARVEQVAGTNALALLFPSPRSRGHWRLRNLHKRLFVPAALAAGWPSVTFEAPVTYRVRGKLVKRQATMRQWKHTIHALRHRFATTARDRWKFSGLELRLAGGWASDEFVSQRYYAVTPGVLDSAAEKQRNAKSRAADPVPADEADETARGSDDAECGPS